MRIVRGRHARTWFPARVSLAFTAAPGLAFALDHLGAFGEPLMRQVIVRVLLLGLGSLFLFRVARDGTVGGISRAMHPRVVLHRWRPVVLGAIIGVAVSGGSLGMGATVLLAAAIEEVLFREQLPRVADELLQRVVKGRVAAAVAMIGSQLSFALTHFVVAGHGAPLSSGLPFFRLVAAGCFLAMIYRSAGLTSAILVHSVLNLWMLSGRFGVFEAPTTTLVLVALGCSLLLLATSGGSSATSVHLLREWRARPPR